jgi:ubiquinone/menaquinone biosynthesis C-methylase UbiE
MSLADLILPFVNDHALASVAPQRAELLASARGRVCEIGFGSGLNVAAYGADVSEILAVEPSDSMWLRGRARAASSGRRVERIKAFAESLPIDAASIDTVVSTFVLCSVRDVERAIAEAKRVLRPGGRLLVIEHVASETPWVATVQRAVRPAWRWALAGCEPTRDLGEALRRAGFRQTHVARSSVPTLPRLVRELVTATLEV